MSHTNNPASRHRMAMISARLAQRWIHEVLKWHGAEGVEPEGVDMDLLRVACDALLIIEAEHEQALGMYGSVGGRHAN